MFVNSLHLAVEILDGGASDLEACLAIKAYRVNRSIVPLILNPYRTNVENRVSS